MGNAHTLPGENMGNSHTLQGESVGIHTDGSVIVCAMHTWQGESVGNAQKCTHMHMVRVSYEHAQQVECVGDCTYKRLGGYVGNAHSLTHMAVECGECTHEHGRARLWEMYTTRTQGVSGVNTRKVRM